MVVSLKDYIEHYADSKVQNFLSEMFRNYTVLFVGYGLAELEVLDHIIRSNESLRSGKAQPRHYLLYAHRSTELVQKQFIEQFFRHQCGVCVLPYCIDSKGFVELVEVFKAWSPELDVRDPTLLDLQAHIDRYVAAPSPLNRESAVRLVQKRPELAPYFVNSLKDLAWFDELEATGFFDVANSPAVTVVESEKGKVYQAEGWPALRYLEHVSSAVSGERAKRVAELVRSVTADSQARGLRNWRTLWSLATIFSQLPLDVIEAADIDMARAWLGEAVEANVVGQELGEKLLNRLLDSTEPVHGEMALALVDALTMLRRSKESM